MVESPVKVVVLSDDDNIIESLSKIDMEFELEVRDLALEDDYIVYTGAAFFYERFEEKLDGIDDIPNEMLIKKGSNEAPGMYKLGSLEDKKYTEMI